MAKYLMLFLMNRSILELFINKVPRFSINCDGVNIHKNGWKGTGTINSDKKEVAWTCKMCSVWYWRKWMADFITANDQSLITPYKTRVEKVEEFLKNRKLKEIKLRPVFNHVSLCWKLIPMTYEEALKYKVTDWHFKKIFNDCNIVDISSSQEKRMTRSSFRKALGQASEIIFVCTRCKIGLCEKWMLSPNSKYVKDSIHHIHPLIYFRVNILLI